MGDDRINLPQDFIQRETLFDVSGKPWKASSGKERVLNSQGVLIRAADAHNLDQRVTRMQAELGGGVRIKRVLTEPRSKAERDAANILIVVPHWFIAVVCGLPCVPALLRVWRRLRARRRRTAGQCSQCGYDLTGNTSGVCLECGGACKTR